MLVQLRIHGDPSLSSYGAPLAMRFATETPVADTKAATLPYLARVITWTLNVPAIGVVLSRPNES
jgi:hypothetical protein